MGSDDGNVVVSTYYQQHYYEVVERSKQSSLFATSFSQSGKHVDVVTPAEVRVADANNDNGES